MKHARARPQQSPRNLLRDWKSCSLLSERSPGLHTSGLVEELVYRWSTNGLSCRTLACTNLVLWIWIGFHSWLNITLVGYVVPLRWTVLAELGPGCYGGLAPTLGIPCDMWPTEGNRDMMEFQNAKA